MDRRYIDQNQEVPMVLFAAVSIILIVIVAFTSLIQAGIPPEDLHKMGIQR